MNIKQSLHFSNLLMLAIPLVLGIAAAGTSMFFIMNVVYRDRTERIRIENDFFNKRDAISEETKSMLEEPDYSNRIWKATELKIKAFKTNTKIAVYCEDGVVFTTDNIAPEDEKLMLTALEIPGGGVISIGTVELLSMFMTFEGKPATALILNEKPFDTMKPKERKGHDIKATVLCISFFAALCITVIIMNQVMTKFVFKKIALPLDALTYGVRQIRDGNLDYRISYSDNTEFQLVCEDFNEMAGRLKTSVDTDRKNEQNRKELFAGISHDLRTPLTSISAYIQGLIDGIPQTEEARLRYMETIQAKTADIVQTVDKLFLFSKLELEDFPFYPEPVDINSAIKDFYELNYPYYSAKDVSLFLQLQDKTGTVYIDPVQLQNALNNIIENSVKYSNSKQCRVVISVRLSDSTADIVIEDNGPGVSEEALPKLFDVFYRADPSRSNPHKGSGLGLAITAKLLNKQNGTISAENIYDSGHAVSGLRICIRLPLVAPEV